MGYYVSQALIPLSEWWYECGSRNFRKLIVHADHARRHSATVSQQFRAQNAIVVAAHPSSSPALAPSGFYLFEYVKGLFRGESFKTGETLLSATEVMLSSLEKWSLTKVFLEWMRRLE
jgi:hypothetical protein